MYEISDDGLGIVSKALLCHDMLPSDCEDSALQDVVDKVILRVPIQLLTQCLSNI